MRLISATRGFAVCGDFSNASLNILIQFRFSLPLLLQLGQLDGGLSLHLATIELIQRISQRLLYISLEFQPYPQANLL